MYRCDCGGWVFHADAAAIVSLDSYGDIVPHLTRVTALKDNIVSCVNCGEIRDLEDFMIKETNGEEEG